MNELMKQAREMQEQMKKAQEEAINRVVEGESGAGMVKVMMNGRHDVKEIRLADDLMTEDKAIIEDLVAAAVNDAVRKIEDQNKEALSGMAGGFKLPEGFKFPF
ncbi:MAG: YbaB/EbfC family nucleoid-associated protein [Pseudomonadales bacterium]|nr:YbaB/EbfC family nucleoid-associated protein [Pseudomonadales bacterium]MCP5346287.1 YbaB/EbfC family nucleoid-associated protein [Pseudomonadales bacterium]